jgi:hypothetical protein
MEERARQDADRTAECENDKNSGKQLTRKQQIIQSFFAHCSAECRLFFFLLIGLIALFANLVLLGSLFAT